MQLTTLKDVFIHILSDVYSAEKQLTKALSTLASEAENPELVTGFQEHLQQTQGHIDRIDQLVANESDIELISMTCAAMEGLIKEADEIIECTEKGSVRDAALIAAAQKVEHYEIATYGTLCTLADQLGYDDASDLLAETLEEEKETDQKLTDIAVSQINLDAEDE
ncbi:ferritin-like domain-containing protein [Enterobacter sp.]|nr:ferritin-like domain-containing protein [Enterobacter sp.]